MEVLPPPLLGVGRRGVGRRGVVSGTWGRGGREGEKRSEEARGEGWEGGGGELRGGGGELRPPLKSGCGITPPPPP